MDTHQVFELIKRSVLEVVPELQDHNFTKTDSLGALGVGSMERADIVIMSLERLELKIPLAETFGPKNLGELADLLSSKVVAV